MVQWNFFKEFVRQMYEEFIPEDERIFYETERSKEYTLPTISEEKFNPTVEEEQLSGRESSTYSERTTPRNSEEEFTGESTPRTMEYEITVQKPAKEISTQVSVEAKSPLEIGPQFYCEADDATTKEGEKYLTIRRASKPQYTENTSFIIFEDNEEKSSKYEEFLTSGTTCREYSSSVSVLSSKEQRCLIETSEEESCVRKTKSESGIVQQDPMGKQYREEFYYRRNKPEAFEELDIIEALQIIEAQAFEERPIFKLRRSISAPAMLDILLDSEDENSDGASEDSSSFEISRDLSTIEEVDEPSTEADEEHEEEAKEREQDDARNEEILQIQQIHEQNDDIPKKERSGMIGEKDLLEKEPLIEDTSTKDKEVLMEEGNWTEDGVLVEKEESQILEDNIRIEYKQKPSIYRIADTDDLEFAIPSPGKSIPMDREIEVEADKSLLCAVPSVENFVSMDQEISEIEKEYNDQKEIEENQSLFYGSAIALNRGIEKDEKLPDIPQNDKDNLFYAIPPPGKSIPMDRNTSKEVDESLVDAAANPEKDKVDEGAPPPRKSVPPLNMKSSEEDLNADILDSGNIALSRAFVKKANVTSQEKEFLPMDIESPKSLQEQNAGKTEQIYKENQDYKDKSVPQFVQFDRTTSTHSMPRADAKKNSTNFAHMTPRNIQLTGQENSTFAGARYMPYVRAPILPYPGPGGFPCRPLGRIPYVPILYPGIGNFPYQRIGVPGNPDTSGVPYSGGAGGTIPCNMQTEIPTAKMTTIQTLEVGGQTQSTLEQMEKLHLSPEKQAWGKAKLITITPKESAAIKIGDHVVYIKYEPSVRKSEASKESKSAIAISTQTEPEKFDMATQYDLEEESPHNSKLTTEVQASVTPSASNTSLTITEDSTLEDSQSLDIPELSFYEHKSFLRYPITDLDEITDGEDLSADSAQSHENHGTVQKPNEKGDSIQIGKRKTYERVQQTDPSISTDSEQIGDSSSASMSPKQFTSRRRGRRVHFPLETSSLERVKMLPPTRHNSFSGQAVLRAAELAVKFLNTDESEASGLSESKTSFESSLFSTTSSSKSLPVKVKPLPAVITPQTSSEIYLLHPPQVTVETPKISASTGAIPKIPKESSRIKLEKKRDLFERDQKHIEKYRRRKEQQEWKLKDEDKMDRKANQKDEFWDF